MDEEKIYIICGIGNCYFLLKNELKKKLHISYLYDRKWEETQLESYDNYPIVRKRNMRGLTNAIAIIMTYDFVIKESIAKDMEEVGISYVFVEQILGFSRLRGDFLKSLNIKVWEDEKGNRIEFDETLPDNIHVILEGSNNRIVLGRNLQVGHLVIGCGNDAVCKIGDNTEIIEAEIWTSYAEVNIGADCLISKKVVIRTHDSHYIFDKQTLKRLNFPKNVCISDQVWIGEKATLLPGTYIGKGTVIGANTVTSSQFEEFCIIAGNPGRVIRKNVCWCKDNTSFSNLSNLMECFSKDVLKYLE